MSREQIPHFLMSLLGKPVRWHGAGTTRTLDVFDASAGEQRALNRLARKHRAELAAAAGGPVLLVFHQTLDKLLRLP